MEVIKEITIQLIKVNKEFSCDKCCFYDKVSDSCHEPYLYNCIYNTGYSTYWRVKESKNKTN